MWFKNLKIFRVRPDWSITADDLAEKLASQSFVSTNPGQGVNLGWVPIRENAELAYHIEGCYFFALQAEKKLLPSSVINQFARAKAAEVEQQQGYKPGRKQMKEIKEFVTDALLPKAFSILRQTRVCLDIENHWLFIESGTAAKADEVISQLVKIFEPMPIQSLMTEVSPSSAMTAWLCDDHAPQGFNMEPQAEFKSTQQERATIRFANIVPEHEEVIKHVESGKICSKLGLTWQDRISFVLNDALELKRITPLEILNEANDLSNLHEDERFDADMMLMSKELNQLLAELIDALGGEKKHS